MTHYKNRLIKGLIITFVAIAAGSTGYKLLGGPEWSLLDSIYMCVITLSTVGFSETQDMSNNPYARILTIFIILFGTGSILFVVSTVTGFIVESKLTNVFGRRKMLKEISVLKNHFIVCGIGDIGIIVIDELIKTKMAFVIVDTDLEKLEKLNETEKVLFINDDATNDEALINAGIHSAHGLITILSEDKDNLFVTLTAKQLNPGLRIVSKGMEKNIIKKLKLAGADSVVMPNSIGGLRMVSELIRPTAVSFLDKMLRTHNGKTYRIEEITIPINSKYVGMTLSEANLLKGTRILIVAMKGKEEDLIYNPKDTSIIKEETVIVILGENMETKSVKELVKKQ